MLCVTLSLGAGAEVTVPFRPEQPRKFSTLAISPLASIDGWQAIPLSKKPLTQYQIVADPEDETHGHVLQADSNASASSLLTRINVDPKATPFLHWRWRTANVLKKGDAATKAGDDYPLRVYVVFDVPLESLSFFARSKIRIARSLYGPEVPVAALCYVWDAKQPAGSTMWNAFTDRLRMIVLESGAQHQNKWVTEHRDVAADFKAAFGFDAPKITAVLVGADTDNTLEVSRSWFGDLSFSANELAKSQAK